MNEQFRHRGIPKGIEFPLGREDGKKPGAAEGEDPTGDDNARQLQELGLVKPSFGLSRRAVLFGVGAAALSTSGLLALGLTQQEMIEHPLVKKLMDEADDKEYDFDAIVKDAKRYLKDKYGMLLAVGPDKDGELILGDKATLEHYRITLRLLVQELARYPSEMILNVTSRKSVPVRIVDRPESRMRLGEPPYRVGGVVHYWPLIRIALDSSATLVYQQQAIHHEINHALTAKDAVDLSSRWIEMHKPIAANAYDKRIDHTPLAEYFLTPYASTNPREDLATCAEYMMTPLLHIEFLKRIGAATSPITRQILQAKYDSVKSAYLRLSGGKMDERFWYAIATEGIRKAKNTGGAENITTRVYR